MPNPGGAMHTSDDPLLERANSDPTDNVPILASDTALNNEMEPW